MLRRWRNLLARRGQFFKFPPLPPATSGPLVVRRAVQAATSRRSVPVRRGKFLPVVPVSVVAAPVAVPAFRATRARLLAVARRGRFAPLPLAAPPVPSLSARRARLVGVARRAGAFLALPPVQATPPLPQTARRARVAPAARRGEFFAFPLTQQVTAGPGPLVVPAVRGSARRTVPPARRGLFVAVPLVGQLASTGPLAPSVRGRAFRLSLPVRRGRFFVPVPPQVAPVVPAVPPRVVRPTGPRVLTARRGVFLSVAQHAPSRPRPFLGRRRTATGSAPRGRFWSVVPQGAPPAGPGPLAPALRRRERARYLPQARGRRWSPVPDQVIYVPPARGSMRAVVRGAADQRAVVRGGPTTRRSTS